MGLVRWADRDQQGQVEVAAARGSGGEELMETQVQVSGEPDGNPDDGKSPGGVGRWALGLLIVAILAAGAFAVYTRGFGGSVATAEFCARARPVEDVRIPPRSEDIAPSEVKVAAARLVLINERMEEAAPRSLRSDIAEAVERYRAAVRSGEADDLRAAAESDAGRSVADAIETECSDAPD